MTAGQPGTIPWPALADHIASQLGLHFPPERRADLQRGMAEAAAGFGYSDVGACVRWLLTTSLTSRQLHTLAAHLTVGETYFFREPKTFAALAERVLPELIRDRGGGHRQLRLWSAACCTGEEAYSLAMLLHRTIPDLASWRVTILGTDINQQYLKKAAAGIYTEWSFRDTPPGIRERYFTRTPDGRYAIVPEIKGMVTFASLNLADDAWPPPGLGVVEMDLVLCRNVLMYFTPAKFKQAGGHLHRSLARGGWLVVSPSETSQAQFSRFTTVNFPEVIFYRKDVDGTTARRPPEKTAPLPSTCEETQGAAAGNPPAQPGKTERESPSDDLARAASLCSQGRHAEAVDLLLAATAASPAPDPRRFSLLARALANQGRLADALPWCNRWIAADKLDAAAHYFRALILKETGDAAQARSSLQRAIYLQPQLVAAHFALGNLARLAGREPEADKHFGNALKLLGSLPAAAIIPEADGLSAGRLRELINSMRTTKTAR